MEPRVCPIRNAVGNGTCLQSLAHFLALLWCMDQNPFHSKTILLSIHALVWNLVILM